MLTSLSPESHLDPERIRTARLRRGMTMVELADQLGMSARRIRSYEKDGAPPAAATALAGALRFPAAFFSRRGTPDLTDRRIAFRAGRSTTKRQRDAAIASGALGVEIGSWISSQFTLPDVSLPDFSHEPPKLAAILLREAWSLGTRPLPNLLQLCESRGARVFGLPELAESVDAFSFWRDGLPYVFLARRKTPERTRFDLAHELGHLVLHRYSDGESQSVTEREADAFASEFLIPRASIREYLPYNPSIEALLAVKTSFQTSAMALAHSVHKTGWMSDWVYRSACIWLSQRGYRRGEPNGMTHHERSRLFPLVFASTEHGKVSAYKIANELELPRSDVHALTFGTELRIASSTEPMIAQHGNQAPDCAQTPHLRVV